MKELFNLFTKKKQKTNFMQGKKVKLKMNPCGFPSSNNTHRAYDDFFILSSLFTDKHDKRYKAWTIKDCAGYDQGWVYEHEIVILEITLIDLSNQLLEANQKIANIKTEIADIQTKIDWCEETGNTIFNEDEYKVYKTLKLIENKDLSVTEKSKIIAELLKNKHI